MTIALVQSTVTHGSESGGFIASFGVATTAGSLLTEHGNAGLNAAGGITGISDSAGNTWTFSTASTIHQNPPVAVVGGNTMSFCAWTLNAAPATTVDLEVPQMFFTTSVIAEWSGAGAADTAAAAIASPIGAGQSASQALTLARTGELVLLGSNTESTNWTGAPSQLTAFPGGFSPNIGYALGQTGTQTYTWTGAGSSDSAVIAVAAFVPPQPPVTGTGNQQQGGRSMLRRSLDWADL